MEKKQLRAWKKTIKLSEITTIRRNENKDSKSNKNNYLQSKGKYNLNVRMELALTASWNSKRNQMVCLHDVQFGSHKVPQRATKCRSGAHCGFAVLLYNNLINSIMPALHSDFVWSSIVKCQSKFYSKYHCGIFLLKYTTDHVFLSIPEAKRFKGIVDSPYM